MLYWGRKPMITLTFEQKKSLGFQYLLDALSPNCVYGQELVKQAGPYPRQAQEELERELCRLTCLTRSYEANKSLWDSLELILMNLKEVRGSLKNGADSVLTDLELFELKQFLLQSEKLRRMYQENPALQLPEINFSDTSLALDLLDPEGRRLPGFYIVDAYALDLKAVRDEKKRLEVVLRQEHTQERQQQLHAMRSETVAQEELIQQRIRAELTEKLRPWLSVIQENCVAVGRLDFLIQKAKLALLYGGICPTLTEHILDFKDMINPSLSEGLARRGKAFTPVSFTMEGGTAVITGANMGGKSVALRTIALNVVLAQSGFFVYAREARVPLFDHICLIAEEYQSMQNGLSSFGGEIMQLQNAVEKQKQGYALLIFDELARGTNPDEGAAIVKAVVKYLKAKPTMAILATHYDHVAEDADYHYQVTGLRGVDLDKLSEEIHSAAGQKGIDIISRYMNYGIYQVHGKEECPRDAIHICGLLGLEPELLRFIQEA